MANRWETGNNNRLYFLGLRKSLQMVTAAMKLKDACSWKKSYDQARQHIKMQRHYFANKGPSSQGYGFSNGRVWMWELNHKEGWASKNWCFWILVLEKTLESPLDSKEIKPVNLKEINPEYSLEGLMLKLKLQYFDHLMQRTDKLEKTLILGKIEGRMRRGRQRMRWLDSTTDSRDTSLSKLWDWWWTEKFGMLQFMGSQRVGHDWATELTTDAFLRESLMDLSACLLFSLNLCQGCLGFMNP